MNVPIIWVMGCPGSGKSTISHTIVEKYGFKHIDPRTMADKEIVDKTQKGKQFEALHNEGKEVPLAEIMPMIEKEVMGNRSGLKGFIIDGFPRNKTESDLLKERLGAPSLVIALEVDQDAVSTRPILENANAPRQTFASYQKESKDVLNQYANITMQIDGSRDPNDVFQDIVPNMETLIKNRGDRIAIGR